MTRPYIGPSDAQANAEALGRRAAPYAGPSDVSFRTAWDYRHRASSDLKRAVRRVREAYADEVPENLHEKGEDGIGPGGTPKWTVKAEGYIFGEPDGSDAKRNPETGEWDALSYFYSPFRAALDNLLSGHDGHPQDYVCEDGAHRRGRIVQHITIGGQEPAESAIKEGIPSWCAELVAADALIAFLRNLSDVRINLARREPAA